MSSRLDGTFWRIAQITVGFIFAKLIHVTVDLVDRPRRLDNTIGPKASTITIPPFESTQILLKQLSCNCTKMQRCVGVSGASSAVADEVLNVHFRLPLTPYPNTTLFIKQRNIDSNRPALQATNNSTLHKHIVRILPSIRRSPERKTHASVPQ